MSAAEMQRHEEQKLADMKASIAVRLQRVCDGMDKKSFDALVLQIAQFKIKWGESLIYDNPPALGAWMFGREKDDKPK